MPKDSSSSLMRRFEVDHQPSIAPEMQKRNLLIRRDRNAFATARLRLPFLVAPIRVQASSPDRHRSFLRRLIVTDPSSDRRLPTAKARSMAATAASDGYIFWAEAPPRLRFDVAAGEGAPATHSPSPLSALPRVVAMLSSNKIFNSDPSLPPPAVHSQFLTPKYSTSTLKLIRLHPNVLQTITLTISSFRVFWPTISE
jgi:hypothetical protein